MAAGSGTTTTRFKKGTANWQSRAIATAGLAGATNGTEAVSGLTKARTISGTSHKTFFASAVIPTLYRTASTDRPAVMILGATSFYNTPSPYGSNINTKIIKSKSISKLSEPKLILNLRPVSRRRHILSYCPN